MSFGRYVADVHPGVGVAFDIAGIDPGERSDVITVTKRGLFHCRRLPL